MKDIVYQEVKGNFKVRYHRQDTSSGCGWACAQMVLNSVNPPPGEFSSQFDLDQDLISGNWNTEPNSLAGTLTDNQMVDENFHGISCDNEEAISRLVVATIFEKNIAPSVLVWDENHWVVVYGCDVSKAPKKVDGKFDPFDTGYKIEAFYVHDPSPGPPFGSDFGETEIEHTDDDTCGTGGLFGRSHIWIDYAHWKEYWLTGVDTTLQPDWYGEYVTVATVDPNLPCPDLPSRPPGRVEGSSEPTEDLPRARKAAEEELKARTPDQGRSALPLG